MLKKLLKIETIGLSLLLILTVAVGFTHPRLHETALMLRTREERVESGTSVLSLLKEEPSVAEASGENKKTAQLSIALPKEFSAENVSVADDYMNQKVTVTLDGIPDAFFETSPMTGSAEHIRDIIFEQDGRRGIISILLDGVYESESATEQNALSLSFRDPHELYDYVVVLDAGHGGADGGSASRGAYEKDINLAILKKLQAVFETDTRNIGIYVTRIDDSFVSIYRRAALASAANADLFLSIHNNALNGAQNSYVTGSEVMYRTTDESGGSEAFANRCLLYLTGELGTESKGLISGDQIYIVRTAKMPVALCEIGFMTNPEELGKLLDEDYQMRAANALHDAIVEQLYGE